MLLAVLGVAGCEVRTAVVLDVADDGSGTVTVRVQLDEAALARVPDDDGDGTATAADLASLVRTDDLAAVGWTVGEAEPTDAGGATMQVSRAFGTPAEAQRIITELTGDAGALSDLSIDRTASFARTAIGVDGSVDLSGGLESFGDEGLAAALEGEPLGQDAATIEADIGMPLDEAVQLEVTADLAGDEHTWEPRLGERLDVSAERTVWDLPVVALAAGALAAVVALVVVLLARRRRSRRS